MQDILYYFFIMLKYFKFFYWKKNVFFEELVVGIYGEISMCSVTVHSLLITSISNHASYFKAVSY